MKKNNFYLLGMLALLLAFGTVLAACSKNDSGATGWEKALKDYEKVVDEYVALMKKANANPSDISILEKIPSLMERLEKASDSISELEDELSDKDLEKFAQRYMKIIEKLEAVQE